MVVAGYRLERMLGQGGMGVVYEATQLSLDRTVALKIVTPGLSADVGFRARFRREGLAQARLDHPNIVAVYEAGEFDGILFLAMRLVRGASLKEMIIGKELDAQRSLRVLAPVADALDSAHEAGLIHRDVKPHNILVGARDHPYLADFGLTKSTQDTGLTRTGQFLGSLDYISPEQIRGEPATSASDVYALGAVLFECLAGAVPYPKDSDAAILYAHVAEAPPRLSARLPALSAALDDVVARAMAKEPGDRQATAGELIHDAEFAFRASPSPGMPISESPKAGAEEGTRTAGTKAGVVPSPPGPSAANRDAPARFASGPIEGMSSGARDPAASASAERWARPRSAVLGVGAAIVVLAGGGFAIGHSGSTARSASNRLVKDGRVEVTVPAAWKQPGVAPSIPGLSLTDGAAREDPASGGVLLVGTLRGAGGTDLLTPSFLARLDHSPSARDRVRLGSAGAYRYRALNVSGLSRSITLLVAPTTQGVVGLGCLPTTTDASMFLAACEQAAGTLRVTGAGALPLGPDPAYGAALSKAVSRLSSAQPIARSLASARTRAGQAALCTKLAQAHAAAATTLAAAKPGADAAGLNDGLLSALRGAADGYGAMSRAARAGRVSDYDAARNATARELVTIRQELASLKSVGYGT